MTIVCTRPECQTSIGCICTKQWWPNWVTPPATVAPFILPGPMQSLPVQLPVPYPGQVTIAIMHSDGSITIKVNQPDPQAQFAGARPVTT